MKPSPFCLTVFTALPASLSPSPAETVRLAPVFSDGVVIQRARKAPVWGKADAHATVEVQLGAQRLTGKAGADGSWRVDFDPLPAGGPFTLVATSGSTAARVENVLAGDVWLCSGQSNMQFTVKEEVAGAQAVANAGNVPAIRLLQMGRGGHPEPQTGMTAKWVTATPDTVKDFSAVAYFFALGLRQDPNLKDVPLGLIDSSFGGTAAEAWTPAAGMEGVPPDNLSGSMFGIPPSALYNNMINPLVPFAMSGVIWYQGEANAGKPGQYTDRLTAMITQWRKAWDEPGLPFFIVQLPPFSGRMGPHFFTWTREAEANVAKALPHVHLAVTLNTHDGSDLHPREKKEIGNRLALLARKHVHGEKVTADSPVPKDISIHGPKVQVKFETDGSKLAGLHGGRLRGFSLAGADGEYHFAEAMITGDDTVVLESESVKNPQTVRYAWAAVPQADLVNTAGLPAAPFRTDTFAPESSEFQHQPVIRRIETPDYEITIDGQGRVVSLGVHGEQFLSNALGPKGATTIPGFFGPRTLPLVEDLGPRRVAARDGSAKLEIACRLDGMTWELTNHGNDPFDFRINLASGVEVSPQDQGAGLKCGKARLTVTGISQVQGQTLVIRAQPGSATQLTWKLQ